MWDASVKKDENKSTEIICDGKKMETLGLVVNAIKVLQTKSNYFLLHFGNNRIFFFFIHLHSFFNN